MSGETGVTVEAEWERLQKSVARLEIRLERLGRTLESLSAAEMQKRQAHLMAVDAIEREMGIEPRTSELRREKKAEARKKGGATG